MALYNVRSTHNRGSKKPMWAIIISVAALFFIVGRISLHPDPPPITTHREVATSATELPELPKRGLELRKDLPVEIWARGDTHEEYKAVLAALTSKEVQKLQDLCSRTIYHGLENIVVSHEMGYRTFFATGDLPLMWIRDSAFQIGVLLPKISRRPSLRFVIEGAIRLQAFYILQDPYANGFYPEWRHPADHNDMDRVLGRGGWVGVRNYELDSGAYYLNLLWNYLNTPGIYKPEALLAEPLIYEAAALTVRTWITEQRHNASTSPYRFTELPNEGLGTPVGYTGMIWSGFRPSDDANTYGFSIPSNMYAAGGLERALEINRAIWQSVDFEAKASKLLKEVVAGINSWGIVESEPGGPKVYAYEVDGLGNNLHDFDDPNWPSLVSMPLLGYKNYDPAVYAATRKRLLSSKNKYWFEGSGFKGMGSPHTSHGMAWALGTLSEAMTAVDQEERVEKLRLLLKLQCKDGLMHESIHVNDLTRCTRRWFEWANALSVVAIEHFTGADCDAAAEVRHRQAVAQRENYSGPTLFKAQFHQSIEQAVQWDVKYEPRVEDWKGIGNVI